tara:strand:- start:1162 stop:1662 length:501 start_codon:yes stop_codon:yes gene_type:complete
MINRKGQEEIVGFVLIVVIVAVVFLVLLGIFLRSDSGGNEIESREISQFLDSAIEYTTDCAIGFEPNYLTLGELIRECHEGGICTSEKKGCEVLDDTLSDLLDSSWQVGPDRAIKGYVFNATFGSDSGDEEIRIVESGECGFNIRGADNIINAQGGVIVYSLKLCY